MASGGQTGESRWGGQPGSNQNIKSLRVVDGDLWVGGSFVGLGSDYSAMLVRRGPLGRPADSDGVAPVDLGDINCFVAALVGPAVWSDCGTLTDSQGYVCANDVNRDGQVDFNDLDEFVSCIAMGCEQPTP